MPALCRYPIENPAGSGWSVSNLINRNLNNASHPLAMMCFDTQFSTVFFLFYTALDLSPTAVLKTSSMNAKYIEGSIVNGNVWIAQCS